MRTFCTRFLPKIKPCEVPPNPRGGIWIRGFNHSYQLQEWIAREMEKGDIKHAYFTSEQQLILLHGHCYQKAMTFNILLSDALKEK